MLLEELDKYDKAKDRDALTRLINAKTPEEAYKAACAYQTAASFFSTLKAAVSVGRQAAKELTEEE